MERNRKSGWTMIEFIVIVAIIGIIAAVGAHSMIYLLRSSSYVPNKMNVDMAASDALDIIVDGDAQVKGLRFCKEIQSIIDTGTQEGVVFINQDDVPVLYLASQNELYRSIDVGGGWTSPKFIPYYHPSKISIFGKGGDMFKFYDQNEALTTVPADVRRIEISLVAQIGSGDIDLWEAESELITAVSVKKMTP